MPTLWMPCVVVSHNSRSDCSNDIQVRAFAANFPTASERANELDARILSEASEISPLYGNLVSLAARQAAAGMELTVEPDMLAVGSDQDVKMFMQSTGEYP